ncbi:MAG: hypothetical protein D6762_06640 [Candidatus Neomarinimicrobiota bacterium]|nr:MAG: hypothetical protein D6762_06640 [Candidatus Neomarinimicrobiota bacterium]
MKHRYLLSLFFALPLLGQSPATVVTRQDSRHYEGHLTWEFAVPETPAPEVDLRDIQGDVFIRGQGENQVTVLERMTIRTRDEALARKLVNQYHLDMSRSDSNRYSFRGPRHVPNEIHYLYDVTLPPNARMTVSTLGGNIHLNQVQGVLQLRTGGGNIDIQELVGVVTGKTSGGNFSVNQYEGVLTLETSGGNITIQQGDGPLDVTTSGGDIRITHIHGDATLSTSGGSLYLEDVHAQTITGTTSGGNIQVQSSAGELHLSTSGGHIHLMDIQGPVEATTSGGNITAVQIEGPLDVTANSGSITGKTIQAAVKATTRNGHIMIEKTWDHSWDNQAIRLENQNGNITLKLPKDFPASVLATIVGQKSPSGLLSDIPLDINVDAKALTGKGITDQGTYQVELITKNGTIVIKQEP